MSITLSNIAQTQLDQTYRAVTIMLDKGQAHARDAGVEEMVYLDWRLAADMFPLVKQVQLVSDFSARGMARLAGVDPASMPDEETSFDALKVRIAKSRDFVWSLDTAAIDADPEGPVTFPAGPDRELTLPRRLYLQNYMISNTLFHASTAYGLLRAIGVPLGKADMMGMSQR